MVRAGVVGSWAVMGWWVLEMNHQGSVGLGLRQGTHDDVLGLVFGQPKGEEEQLGSYFRKGAKGAVLCPFSLTACAGFSRALGARKIKRERPAVKRREPCGVVLSCRRVLIVGIPGRGDGYQTEKQVEREGEGSTSRGKDSKGSVLDCGKGNMPWGFTPREDVW
ncbi:hypothetical protein F2Q69_00047797 [Brassica cretica]|uniref:Uncharacterized protein n=1 Tax=Brassica cretica TaxID=69181 RepID=A0A8S9Q1J9_BRACR|nr:hypothetical protein F2Q69_00047797 [Brassica cretica]